MWTSARTQSEFFNSIQHVRRHPVAAECAKPYSVEVASSEACFESSAKVHPRRQDTLLHLCGGLQQPTALIAVAIGGDVHVLSERSLPSRFFRVGAEFSPIKLPWQTSVQSVAWGAGGPRPAACPGSCSGGFPAALPGPGPCSGSCVQPRPIWTTRRGFRAELNYAG